MAIIFQSRFLASRNSANSIRQALAELPPAVRGGLLVSVVVVDLDKTPEFAEVLRRASVTVAYVCVLRSLGPSGIMQITRELGILSVTGVPDYVEEGLSVGADLRGNRARLVINLTAARAEGADLPAQVLKLARIID